MEPTHVVIGRMDSQRPGLVVTLLAEHLTLRRRFVRALGHGGAVMGIGLLISNFLLLLIPVPHLHVCSIPLSILLGPIVAAVTWRTRVLLATADVPCPKCTTPVTLPEKLGGWPARFNCPHCAIMIELNAAR
jgi:hypothetical protein